MKLKNQFGQGSGFEGQDFRQQQYGANPYPAQQMGYSVPPQTQGQMQGQMQQGFSPMPSTGSSQGGQGMQSSAAVSGTLPHLLWGGRGPRAERGGVV